MQRAIEIIQNKTMLSKQCFNLTGKYSIQIKTHITLFNLPPHSSNLINKSKGLENDLQTCLESVYRLVVITGSIGNMSIRISQPPDHIFIDVIIKGK